MAMSIASLEEKQYFLKMHHGEAENIGYNDAVI